MGPDAKPQQIERPKEIGLPINRKSILGSKATFLVSRDRVLNGHAFGNIP